MTHPLLMPSPYESDEGNLIGRDPRDVSAEEYFVLLQQATVGMKAIRAKCLDCTGGNAAEVRKCVAVNCSLWPLRMGCQPAGLRESRAA